MKTLIKKYKRRLIMEQEALSDAITTERPSIDEIKGINECIGIYQEVIADLKTIKRKYIKK